MPDQGNQALCRSCDAAIIWAKTKKGKTMPVDAEPHPEGTVRLLPDGSCEVMTKADLEHVRKTEDLGGPYTRLHRSHFSSCPQAQQHRKSK